MVSEKPSVRTPSGPDGLVREAGKEHLWLIILQHSLIISFFMYRWKGEGDSVWKGSVPPRRSKFFDPYGKLGRKSLEGAWGRENALIGASRTMPKPVASKETWGGIP